MPDDIHLGIPGTSIGADVPATPPPDPATVGAVVEGAITDGVNAAVGLGGDVARTAENNTPEGIRNAVDAVETTVGVFADKGTKIVDILGGITDTLGDIASDKIASGADALETELRRALSAVIDAMTGKGEGIFKDPIKMREASNAVLKAFLGAIKEAKWFTDQSIDVTKKFSQDAWNEFMATGMGFCACLKESGEAAEKGVKIITNKGMKELTKKEQDLAGIARTIETKLQGMLASPSSPTEMAGVVQVILKEMNGLKQGLGNLENNLDGFALTLSAILNLVLGNGNSVTLPGGQPGFPSAGTNDSTANMMMEGFLAGQVMQMISMQMKQMMEMMQMMMKMMQVMSK